ncbi:MAG: bifunctional folylpolyglutamate synthase/dihydrofolate synthase [Kiritimatiellaeota bacterium]|nr:bifunctional folylpolyglutamate synthase/dihydrofolate synthase [Kiritimatiellota bacterium]
MSSTAAQLQADLAALFQRTSLGLKFDLGPTAAMLRRLGDPQRSLLPVHVAGTNGKGSVCAMIEAVLRAAGHRAGLYTSPHLVRFNERIRVAGACIGDAELAGLFREIETVDRELAAGAGGRELTFFEFTTALALEYFRRAGVRLVVLETGMGGRLDATNVVEPLLAVITRIAIEHTAYLGKTLPDIALEKAGIIKPGWPVLCGQMPDAARDVIRRVARERSAPLIAVEDAASVRRLKQDWTGQRIKIETANGSYPPLTLPLLGAHQLENVALAVAALEWLNGSTPFHWEVDALRAGLTGVQWPGRCQVLSRAPVTLLDVAHNPNGAAALAETLRGLTGRHPVGLVVGLLGDKDGAGFFRALAPRVSRCWAVPLAGPRNMPREQLLADARSAGLAADYAPLNQALAAARAWALDNDGIVCIAGSLVLAGEVLAAMGLDPYPGNGL